MNGLPKILSYLAMAASFVSTYFASTGHAPPAFLSNILVLVAALSHGILGQGNLVTPSVTTNLDK